MLLWPSYQAEVIFATPPKKGAASPPWLKALLSPRPKWQTWFYLYILTRVCGAECWESYLKLYKDLADSCWLVELFIFLHWVNHLNLCSLSPVTADSGCCQLPKSYHRCHNGKVRGDRICLSDYEKQGESIWRRGTHTFQLWANPRRHLQMSSFESSDGDRLCMRCRKGLVIVTVKYNSSVLSQPFQMYLFLQATIQNTCCQLVFI